MDFRRALRWLRCWASAPERHRPPDDHDPAERWATCVRCSERFDLAEQRDEHAELMRW